VKLPYPVKLERSKRGEITCAESPSWCVTLVKKVGEKGDRSKEKRGDDYTGGEVRNWGEEATFPAIRRR